MNNKELKLLKKEVNKSKKLALSIVLDYFKNVKLDETKFKNIIGAAELIIDFEIERKISEKEFNKVLTVLFNSATELKEIKRFINDNSIISLIDQDIQIGENLLVFCSGTQPLLSSKTDDFCFVKQDGHLFILISEQHSSGNNIDSFISENIFGNESNLLPIINKKFKNAQILNGKNWVKHYSFNNQEGILYFLEMKIKDKTFFKVGITKFSVSKRFNNSDYIISFKEVKMNMLKASIIEQYIHQRFYNVRFHLSEIDDTFEGKNECYFKDLYSEFEELDFNLALSLVSENNNIDKNILKSILISQGVEIG